MIVRDSLSSSVLPSSLCGCAIHMFETIVGQGKQSLQFICFSQNQYVSLHSSYVVYLNFTVLLPAKLLYQTWTSVLLLFWCHDLSTMSSRFACVLHFLHVSRSLAESHYPERLSCQEQPVRDAHQWVFKQELLVKFSIVSDKWRFCFSSFSRVIVSFLPGHILLLSSRRRKSLIAFFALSE